MSDEGRRAEIDDKDILRRIESIVEQEDDDREAFRDAILAVAPAYPEPRLEQEYNAFDRLRYHWSESQIREWVDSLATDDVGLPDDVGEGGRPDVETFLALIGLIAEGEYARTLPEHDMLLHLAGQEAARGHRQSRGFKKTRLDRSEITKQNAKRWQQLAEALVIKNPHLKSKSDVARQISKETGDPANTIRKYIEI